MTASDLSLLDDPTAPTGDRPARRADIQGLRAIAVLLVVAFHVRAPLPGGFIGVDVFFVISGFVITGLLLRGMTSSGRVSFVDFYTRRARRVLPALATTIVVVAVLSVLLLSPLGPQQTTARTGASASAFLANVYVEHAPTGYFDLPAHFNALLHTWSLSVEEQFYLVFPAIFVGAWSLAARMRRRRVARGAGSETAETLGRAGVFGVLLVLTGASFLVSFVMSDNQQLLPFVDHPSQFAFYSAVTRAWEFLAGALLAVALPVVVRIPRGVALAAGAVGAIVLVVAARTITESTPYPRAAALAPVIGTALLLLAGARASGGVTALLGIGPLVWLGDRSYAWYLWHWPFIVFVGTIAPHTRSRLPLLAAAALALVVACVSYRWIERPLHLNQSLRGRRVVTLIAICTLVPLTMSLALLGSASVTQSLPSARAFVAIRDHHAGETRGCDSAVPIGERHAPRCTWHVPDSRGRVFLVGDSIAAQYAEPVALAAASLRYDLTVATYSTCPFADVISDSDIDPAPGCRRFVERSVASLRRIRPTLVIISASAGYTTSAGFRFAEPGSQRTVSGDAAKLPIWRSALASTFRALTTAGIPVLFVHANPEFFEFAPLQCSAVQVVIDAPSCGRSQPRSLHAGIFDPLREAENAAIASAPGARAADFADELCSPSTCATNHGDRWLYADAYHLTISGALTLTDDFRRLIAETTGANARTVPASAP